MKRKQLIQNITISIIIGIILGSITEFALILDISWLIKITQSLMFWGIVMCICVLISKNYNLTEDLSLIDEYNQINKVWLY